MVIQDDDLHTHKLFPENSSKASETPLEKYCSCGALDEHPIEVGSTVFCHPLEFANCFPQRSPQEGGYDTTSGSECLYSPSAPVGPTTCEYCGKANTDHCISNLPGEEPTNDEEKICPRPKLFFLKKRPPFATPEGWNPKTGYRQQLWEPPSSVEGRRGAWGDIRGSLNSQGRSKYVEGIMQKHTDTAVQSSGCGLYEESEVTCSSGGWGEMADLTGEKGDGSLSPVDWVSGLFAEKL